MDALINAAARALARGDALGALQHVALRGDAPALALRGIAMAQLGEFTRARQLLRQAHRAFGRHEVLARARCQLAEAEVALAMRDLAACGHAIGGLADTLDRHGDAANAVQARLVAARRLVLLGRLDDAGAALPVLEARSLPPSLLAIAHLSAAELALRALDADAALAALTQAQAAAARAGIPALTAEVAAAQASLDRPMARQVGASGESALRLGDVSRLLASDDLVLDACRRGLRAAGAWRPLARRPVLFALARALAEAWPGDVAREDLIARAFRTRHPDETHRARLRVELGRLRSEMAGLAEIAATARGFGLQPAAGRAVRVLAPPIEGDQASLMALLGDGAAWSTSALAQALGMGQRSVQRALGELEAAGQVRALGQARARRWVAPPLAGFATNLLLPAGQGPA